MTPQNKKAPGTITRAFAVGLTMIAVAGCAPGKDGGSTTIIQTIPPTNNTGGSTSSTSPSVAVTALDDPKKLCNLQRGRGMEIIKAIDAFWDLAVRHGWSWGDEDISKAADNAVQVVARVAPILEGSIGPNAPKDIADAIRNFLKAARDFADTLNNRDNDNLNAVNKSFNSAVNLSKEACQI